MNERLLVLADVKIQLNERIINKDTLISLYDLEVNHPNKNDFSMIGFIMDSLFEMESRDAGADSFILNLVLEIANIIDLDVDLYVKLFEIMVYRYDRTFENYNYLYSNLYKIKQIDAKSKILSSLLELYIGKNDTENIKKFSNELRSLTML